MRTINVTVFPEAIHGRDGVSPFIGDDNHWYVWDPTADEFVDTGVYAGNGPTITDCYVNPDGTITYYFGDGTSFTTPSMKGLDGNKFVYWVNAQKNYMTEGYDGEGIYHSASIVRAMRNATQFPKGFPNVGDYVLSRGGCIFYVNAVSFMYVDMECYANLNGDITKTDEISIDKLFVQSYANIAGLIVYEKDHSGTNVLHIE